MKRVFLIACIFLLLGILSCNKKDEITPPSQFPEWLDLKITELTSEFDLCEYTDVTYIEYKGKLYYHISNGAWSCRYCHVFDENGNRPTWEASDWEDFSANKKEIKIVPACE